MRKIIFTIILFVYSCFPTFANNVNEETLIILDSSVSMLDSINSVPKYVLASNEIKKILDNTDSSKKIGLRIIGITPENALNFLTNTDGFCSASSLISPIDFNNSADIKTKLDTLFPLGATPLTYSLEQAINNDFSLSAYKHIILITDGAESCNRDVCAFIQEQTKKTHNLKIDVIAINVSGSELTQLECLTTSSDGTLINVYSNDDFADAFKKVLNDNGYTPENYIINSSIFDDNIKKDKPNINQIDNIDFGEIKYKNYLLQE